MTLKHKKKSVNLLSAERAFFLINMVFNASSYDNSRTGQHIIKQFDGTCDSPQDVYNAIISIIQLHFAMTTPLDL